LSGATATAETAATAAVFTVLALVGSTTASDDTEGAMAVPNQNNMPRIVSDEKGERQRRT
jgi:hypothetical protein